jgi:DNA-binding response OmpR family regulator
LTASEGNGKTILIVDDESDILLVLKRALERWGYRVDTFSDPQAALDHFRDNSHRYDLILCDIRMPDINGIVFARQVRRQNSKVKLLLMSAFEIDKTISADMPDVRVDQLLQKPFLANKVCEVVGNHLITR